MRSIIPWLVTLGIVTAVAQGAEDDVPSVTEPQAIAIGRMIEVLNSETKVDVTAAPLGDLCRDLGKAHEIKVVIDEAALKKAKISLDSQITIDLRKISLRDSLFKILDPLGLTHKIRPDGLLITTLPEKGK
jgi:hypothetical protein